MSRYMTKRRKIAIRNKCCAIIFCLSFTAGTALSTIFYQTNNQITIPTVEVSEEVPLLEFKPLLSVVEPPEIKEKAVIKDSYDVPNGIEEVYDHIVNVTGNKGLDTELYLAIIKCESGLNPKARNSISTATGIAQFTAGTWSDGVKWRGLDWTLNDRLDYKKSLDMMIWFIEEQGEISRWECLKHI